MEGIAYVTGTVVGVFLGLKVGVEWAIYWFKADPDGFKEAAEKHRAKE